MRVYYDRDNDCYGVERKDILLNEPAIQIDMNEARKDMIYEWMTEQIKVINERKHTSAVGAFFTYIITPTTVGSEITLWCRVLDTKLDLTLIGDEAW